MPHPALRPSSTALITGAASGIGLAIARALASQSLNLLLADINGPALSTVAASIVSSSPSRIETVVADVSSAADWTRLREKADIAFGGKVDVLVLNAGRGSPSTKGWVDGADEIVGAEVGKFRAIFDSNFFGVVNGIEAFVPGMKRRGEAGAVVVTGSKQGITNPPGNPGYNASKAAVKTITEHLSWDLRDTPISVHLLVPGWTHTGMTGGGGVTQKPAGAWAPEQVAEFLLEKMHAGKSYVLCPDNDVTENMDQKRILWGAQDLTEGRPPLTRWRDEWKEEHAKWMQN